MENNYTLKHILHLGLNYPVKTLQITCFFTSPKDSPLFLNLLFPIFLSLIIPPVCSEAGVSHDATGSVICDIMEAEGRGMCIFMIILPACYFLMITGSASGKEAMLRFRYKQAKNKIKLDSNFSHRSYWVI